ncbi:terpene cyclase/mutase family protein [Patescibacteria group bacterium]|nr:terpene cyclase/mutase family protein [Patescibacteria group bacterium]
MRYKTLKISLVTVLVISIGLINFSNVYSNNQSEIDKAVDYLKSQPQTAWSTLALAAAGETGIDLSHLESAPSEQKSVNTYAKYILALVAAGKNPTSFGAEDYVDKLKSYFQNNQFGDEVLLNDDIWAILALGSIGQENLSIVQEAKDYILNNQNTDGGWGYNLASSDTNDTAAAIMALLEAGVADSSTAIQNAISYLKSLQNDDGGFPYLLDSTPDSCSDAWVISAIYKLGQDPTTLTWTKSGKNPLDHLKSLQDEDGGFWWQAEGDNKFCSPFTLLPLLEKSYPVETDYNKHTIRIEGDQNTICNAQVNGGTVIDLVISGSEICGYDYSIIEYPGMGLYLA